MSMPTRPASQAGNPIKGGEDTDSFGSESPRLEVILTGNLSFFVTYDTKQVAILLVAGPTRFSWPCQRWAGA